MHKLLAAILAFALLAPPAIAEEWRSLGVGRLFTNDFIGDGRDRWRSGSYVLSHLRGPAGSRGFTPVPGRVLEYRFRGEIIAPQGSAGGTGDRPYVGLLSVGLHTHFSLGTPQVSVGADLVAIGPQTRLDRFQDRFHDTFGLADVRSDNQIADARYLDANAEIGTEVALGLTTSVRPFVQLRAGTEDLLRIGGDITFAPGGRDSRGLHLRDVVTGHRYPATLGGRGTSLTAGADIARVAGSVFLPKSRGFAVEEWRRRARIGMRYQGRGGTDLFYGLTWLGPEYERQVEGQFLGSLTLRFDF